jgi:hypothetical protein
MFHAGIKFPLSKPLIDNSARSDIEALHSLPEVRRAAFFPDFNQSCSVSVLHGYAEGVALRLPEDF